MNIVIDKVDYAFMKNFSNSNNEFRNYFNNHMEEIFEKCSAIDIEAFRYLFSRFPKMQNLFYEKPSLFLTKMPDRASLLEDMTDSQIQKNINYFFNDTFCNYDTLFIILRRRPEVFTPSEILALLADNIDLIYKSIGITGLCSIFDNVPMFFFDENDECIQKIDKFLASHVSTLNESFFSLSFNFDNFNNMKLFKNEIKKIGPDFFVHFPISNSLDDCKQISREIFGYLTTENLTKMKFGQHNSEKALLMQMIIDELLQHSKSGNTVDDIKYIGSGSFSSAYKVGDFVLKTGSYRECESIPNHRRILQPIIRTSMEYSDDTRYPLLIGNRRSSFIEVQNLVDTHWYKDMSQEEINTVLFEIYSDMRSEGLVWYDVKCNNVGRLLRPNTSHILYMDIKDGKKKQLTPDPKAIDFVGEINGNVLQKGDYVVLDSDCIVPLEQFEAREYEVGMYDRVSRFEKMYQKKLKKETEDQEH